VVIISDETNDNINDGTKILGKKWLNYILKIKCVKTCNTFIVHRIITSLEKIDEPLNDNVYL